MAFSSSTQSDTFPFGNKIGCLFKGTAGASGNEITVNFLVDYVLGGPEDAAFTQTSAGVVTVTGLTNTKKETLLLVGSSYL